MIRICPTCNGLRAPSDDAISDARYNAAVSFYFARLFAEVENLTRDANGDMAPGEQGLFMAAVFRMLNSIEGWLVHERRRLESA